MASADQGYLLDNWQAEAGRRLRAMSELFDEWTFRHLARVGLTTGWRCLGGGRG